MLVTGKCLREQLILYEVTPRWLKTLDLTADNLYSATTERLSTTCLSGQNEAERLPDPAGASSSRLSHQCVRLYCHLSATWNKASGIVYFRIAQLFLKTLF